MTLSEKSNKQQRHFSTNGAQFRRADRSETQQNDRARERLAAREFFLSVLSSAATRRDVKTYLSRYKPTATKTADHTRKLPSAVENGDKFDEQYNWRLDKSGVNLGSLYTYPTAIEQSPVFGQGNLHNKSSIEHGEPQHLAIVKIRAPEVLDAQVLDGVALTLAQLARLGLLSVVVVDCGRVDSLNQEPGSLPCAWRDELVAQADRLATAINYHSKEGARVVDQVLSISTIGSTVPHVVPVRGDITVRLKKLLFAPLDHGIIPVIPPVAYTSGSQMRLVNADDVMLALTREFAGLSLPVCQVQDDWTSRITDNIKYPVALDRIIILDPSGGIPSPEKLDSAQIFVNLEQEYRDLRHRLAQAQRAQAVAVDTTVRSAEREGKLSMSRPSHSLTNSVKEQAVNPPKLKTTATEIEVQRLIERQRIDRHVGNLDLAQRALSLLPTSSSALLTTPAEAAGSALSPSQSIIAPGVGTRQKRNPLIHNLLTDKPVVSSSLPAARHQHSIPTFSRAPATFFKRGLPVTIIPDPRTTPWQPPGPHATSLSLESDPRIDFPRLLHLIEDSFGRPLDVHHYLSRISGHIAGVIITGEYEGGAILTWEAPAYEHSRPLVPYLDKFAVLRRSQGSGGVADIVFNAMVRQCFPNGVVWRSRNNNPVNKWYFERAVGTWRLPRSNWCMFWTGEEIGSSAVGEAPHYERKALLFQKQRRWKDYVDVCSRIEASWADREKPPD